MAEQENTTTLTKGGTKWTFSWTSGDEKAVGKRLAELANDPASGFDWFDAALVANDVRNKTQKKD